jgi:hypothetical protein
MRGLLDRNVSSVADRLVILPPPAEAVPEALKRLTVNPAQRSEMLREVQRLRGRIYVQDGAIQTHELTPDGRHETSEDDRSWHLVMLDRQHGQPSACLWYLEHQAAASIQDLRIHKSPPATDPALCDALVESVAEQIAQARDLGIPYSEVGGWATERFDRCSSDGLLLILATYGLSRIVSAGALGVTTATIRHSSAAILKRLGLSYFPVGKSRVPPYFDPRYQCQMELLRFDTRAANPRFETHIDQLMEQMYDSRVIASELNIKLAARPAATAVLEPAVASRRQARAGGRVA